MKIPEKIIINNKIVLSLFGLSYFLIIWGFSFFFIGAGHGTVIPFDISFSPFSAINSESSYIIISIIYWPLIALFISYRRLKLISALLLLFHYIGIPKILMAEDWSRVHHVLKIAPLLLLGWILVYLIGQIYFWICILHKNNKQIANLVS